MSDDIKNTEENKEKQEDKQENLSEENTISESINDEKAEQPGEKNDTDPADQKSAGQPEEITETNKEQDEEKPISEKSPVQNFSGESNYQVSLINENLLRIRLSTLKSVSIDCSVKDRSTPGGDASESQTNKIQIHPKPDSKPQEVEIIISIDPESGNLVVEKKKIIL
jgi:hypothetical protein